VRAFHVDGEASPWDDDEADPAIDDASAVAGTSGDSDGADASPGASSGAASPGMAAADGSAAAPQAKPARGAPDPLPKWPGVRVDDTLGEAGRKVLAFHLARMLAREAGTREGVVEELHKMRVATRRMRATWRTFEGAYRPKRAGRYVRELKAVADRLGAVRDLDVQLEGLQAYAAANPGDAAGLEPLERAYRARRDAARDELLALLDSDAYRRFVEDYQAFVATPGDAERLSAPGMPSRVRDTAGGRIWTSYEHLRAYHDVLAWADVPTIHEVRIAGKRLRYALESFREVLGADADGLIARVTALQDHLGELNDADLAAHLTRDFLVREGARLPAPVAAALGRYLASREREVHARRRGLPAVWRQVVGPPFRRTLGRAISSL
jgi:CHAD domain-containing protein